jgi:hypothetical protein
MHIRLRSGRERTIDGLEKQSRRVDEKATFQLVSRLISMKQRSVWKLQIAWLGITVLYAALSAVTTCAFALAQAPAQLDPDNAPGAAPVAASPGLSQAILEWTPPALSQLGGQAVAKESFTLDRTMLAAAAGLMPDSDADLRQTVAKLDGVSVHVLRFAADGQADPSQVEAIRDAYHLRGWKHVLSSTNLGGATHSDITDVWLVLDGANVRGGVVLVESPKSLTLATVSGNLSPVDLPRLRGHFGIPRFDSDGLTGGTSR